MNETINTHDNDKLYQQVGEILLVARQKAY